MMNSYHAGSVSESAELFSPVQYFLSPVGGYNVRRNKSHLSYHLQGDGQLLGNLCNTERYPGWYKLFSSHSNHRSTRKILGHSQIRFYSKGSQTNKRMDKQWLLIREMLQCQRNQHFLSMGCQFRKRVKSGLLDAISLGIIGLGKFLIHCVKYKIQLFF